ncbi:glycosyltransferase family 2 protein [Hyunsoonleella pacifica]|uniref:Glycosyltransferase family 2 protein n=1 Tax=Hyunsoonleella pacifica TaxID=1080224 RepID=A0A4Q9FVH7_9FLAO|nr:glycosyltransferase family A protein [Hyunsoonleella pacifica]TBN18522.1 glycosyltransferase family 2 protein [Hyunsoonleella pacifica]GGD02494.1 glycosyl transferase [Hyunsoonleella pacifica]
MIILIHNHQEVVEVLDVKLQPVEGFTFDKNIIYTFFQIAECYPDTLLIWCHVSFKPFLNLSGLPNIFHHNRVFATYNPSEIEFLPDYIGYVEQSYFIKVNKKVRYSTWISSSLVGGVRTSVIPYFETLNIKKERFSCVLNAIAKQGMPNGLFCYSEPKLLNALPVSNITELRCSMYELFKFVKQYYKFSWMFFLLCCLVVFEKKLPLISFIKALIVKTSHQNIDLSDISIKSSKVTVTKKSLDVVIPTIGREKYLYDVLKDFSKQTLLPKAIIIIEQNPDIDSTSKLRYLKAETWPFEIEHHFIHQTGVCNARNLALSKVKSEWVFLGDDDNRFQADMLESLMKGLEAVGSNVGTTVYIQPGETQQFFKTSQTSIFGAGNSIVKSELLNYVRFDDNYEFNYGEDTDFGMQLRNIGEEVVFFPNILITHLKAPIGGYRTKVKQLWESDTIPPKPSPPIMLLKKRYFTEIQLKGYKLLLFLKFYRQQDKKNPLMYYKAFKAQWERSLYWYNILIKG